jgi:hypothetical protein
VDAGGVTALDRVAQQVLVGIGLAVARLMGIEVAILVHRLPPMFHY